MTSARITRDKSPVASVPFSACSSTFTPYEFLEEVASHFAGNDEKQQQIDEEVVLGALDNTQMRS